MSRKFIVKSGKVVRPASKHQMSKKNAKHIHNPSLGEMRHAAFLAKSK